MQRTAQLISMVILLAVFSGCGSDVSELRTVDLKIGTGPEAVPGKDVTVHYTGWLYENGTRGKKFDSSRDGGARPFTFSLGAGQVIQGWDDGIRGMRVGGKRQLIIPPELGYGAQGDSDSIPPNSTLEFEVELLGVSN